MSHHTSHSFLPDAYSMETLERNLGALTSFLPKLVQRVSWPVDGSHILFPGSDRVIYRLHSSEYDLALTEERVEGICADLNGDKDLFVFGIGLGEVIDHLIGRFPDRRITVWDRDPWLIRLFLMKKDYSRHLSTGTLRLTMCADLVSLIPRMHTFHVLFHPFLQGIYQNEARLLSSGLSPKRVLVNTGGIFVEDVVQAFKDLGYTPFLLNLNGLSLEEIEYALIQFMPSIVFSVNYQTGLSELCRRHSLDLLCWEVDPSIERITPLQAEDPRAHIFTYRKKNMEEYRSAGFTQLRFLPLASNPEKRRPVTLEQGEAEKFACPLSFVGSSMFSVAQKYRGILQQVYQEYRRSRPDDPGEEGDPFLKILLLQSDDYSSYRVPDLFREHLAGFQAFFLEKTAQRINPVMLLAEVAACEKRLAYLSRLGPMGIRIWGDEGWKKTEDQGARYMGFSGHTHEINRIYSATSVNIDVSRLYQMDMVNMRIFDILACGGFVLAEHSEGIEDLFEPGSEIVTYHTPEEMEEKARYYLEHREEAGEIANKGMEAVKNRHTVKGRVEQMLHALS